MDGDVGWGIFLDRAYWDRLSPGVEFLVLSMLHGSGYFPSSLAEIRAVDVTEVFFVIVVLLLIP